MHIMYVPNSMRSCAVSTVVYMLSRAVGPSGSVPLTLITSAQPDASTFRVLGFTVFEKVPGRLRRKVGEKAFPGVIVGYPSDTLGYCAYNHVMRRITAYVHVML
jgi:hypothetical protein